MSPRAYEAQMSAKMGNRPLQPREVYLRGAPQPHSLPPKNYSNLEHLAQCAAYGMALWAVTKLQKP